MHGCPLSVGNRRVRRRRRQFVVAACLRLALGFAAFSGSMGGAAGGATLAQAQAQPPERFYGSVQINGQAQGDGTVVEAYIGNTLCGSGTVGNRNGSEIYFVDVLGAGQKANCGNDGDKVTFKVSGLDAKETGTYATASTARLDLSATGSARPVEQPTVLAPGTGGTPAPPPTFTPAPTQASAAPASTTPAAGETATAAPATTATAGASGTVTATQTPNVTLTPVPVRVPATKSSGPSPLIWIVIVVAVLAIGAGAAAWALQRRGRP